MLIEYKVVLSILEVKELIKSRDKGLEIGVCCLENSYIRLVLDFVMLCFDMNFWVNYFLIYF